MLTPSVLKSMSTKKTIKFLVLLNFVILIGYGVKGLLVYKQKALVEKRDAERAARMTELASGISHDDYSRMSDIGHSILKTGRISDVDLDWCLTSVKSSMASSNAFAYLTRSSVFMKLSGLKHVSPMQRQKIYDTTILLFNTHNDSEKYGLDKEMASMMVAKLNDKRGIPYLLPLLNDPRPHVRGIAQSTLTSLGYKTPS